MDLRLPKELRVRGGLTFVDEARFLLKVGGGARQAILMTGSSEECAGRRGSEARSRRWEDGWAWWAKMLDASSKSRESVEALA